eukprot:3936404-Rhodomonas_salina.1
MSSTDLCFSPIVLPARYEVLGTGLRDAKSSGYAMRGTCLGYGATNLRYWPRLQYHESAVRCPVLT